MMMACTGQKRLRSDRIHCYTAMDESKERIPTFDAGKVVLSG